MERSATLTPSPERRAERALAAATAKYHVGAFDAALGLLAAAEAGPMDELQRARCDLLRGRIAFASSRGSDAPPLLLKAARRFEPLDLRLARDTYLLAMFAAMFAGSLAGAADLQEVAEAARASPPPPPPRPADLLLDGIAVLMTEGYPAGAPMLTRAVSAFRAGDTSSGQGLRGLWQACHCAGLVWDFDSRQVLADRLVKLARDAGAITSLPGAVNMRASCCAGWSRPAHAGTSRPPGRGQGRGGWRSGSPPGRGIKVVSEITGHATPAFTADVYVTVTGELAEAAAASIAAFVPRKGRVSNQ